MDVHVVITANLFQICEVRDHRRLLAAEGQVDEILHAGEIQLFSHRLKLRKLAHSKAVQPLCQIVQLIKVDLGAYQPIQHRPGTVERVQAAVGFRGIADLQCLQQRNAVVVLISGNGKRDRRNTVFRVVGVAQNCFHHHIASPYFPSKFKIASPYLARSRAQTIRWNASSVTNSGDARSARVILRLPVEMALAA